MSSDAPVLRPAVAADWSDVEELLAAYRLPLEGARQHLDSFMVAEQHGRLLGCIGLERYGDAGLLRSCAVADTDRGGGIGALLTKALIDGARRAGVKQLVLLTTTAENYFARFGFVQISRDAIPAALQDSAEFRGACPASATAMQLVL